MPKSSHHSEKFNLKVRRANFTAGGHGSLKTAPKCRFESSDSKSLGHFNPLTHILVFFSIFRFTFDEIKVNKERLRDCTKCSVLYFGLILLKVLQSIAFSTTIFVKTLPFFTYSDPGFQQLYRGAKIKSDHIHTYFLNWSQKIVLLVL